MIASNSTSLIFHLSYQKSDSRSVAQGPLFATLWIVAYQALPSMGFSRQDYWSGLPFPPPGDLSDPGIKPKSLESSGTGRQILYHWATGEAQYYHTLFNQLEIPGTVGKAGLHALFPTIFHTPVLAQFSLWPDHPTDLYEVRHSCEDTSYLKHLQWCPGT